MIQNGDGSGGRMCAEMDLMQRRRLAHGRVARLFCREQYEAARLSANCSDSVHGGGRQLQISD